MKEDLRSLGYLFNKEEGVWHRPDYEGIAYSDGDEVENRLMAIVVNATDVSVMSLELADYCTDWPSLYHLSRRRANLLRPFEAQLSGRNVLEIGAGCGAITRYLGEAGAHVLALEGSFRRAAIAASRCRGLDNVTIMAEAFHDLKPFPRFEVVTLIGVLEYARMFFPGNAEDPVNAMLAAAKRFLKPGGRLIIAIENQLGLKYFAGFSEDHAGNPMFGIEEHYGPDTVVTFGRRELGARVLAAGLPVQQWWYPFPDYKLASLMVSEVGAFPAEGVELTPVICSASGSDPQYPACVNFNPERALRPIVRNGLLGEVANSFVLLASETDFTERINNLPLAIHFATERRPEFAKKVVFRSADNGTIMAHQVALYPSALPDKNSLLQQHLIDQPFVRGELWQDRLADIMTRPGWTVLQIKEWFKVWLNAFCKVADIADMERASEMQVSGNYFDAIPRNMFVDGKGTATFIDQEWILAKEQSVEFIAFRALFNSFVQVGTIAKPDNKLYNNILSLIIDTGQYFGFIFTGDKVELHLASECEIQRMATGKCALGFHDLASWSFRLSDTQTSLTSKMTERDAAVAEKELTAALVEEMHGSLSWRITSPLRFTVRTLRYGLLDEDRRKFVQRLRAAYHKLPLPIRVRQKISRGCNQAHNIYKANRRRSGTTARFELPLQKPAKQQNAKPDYIVWGVIDWHFRHQRPQQLAQVLAGSGRRVFYVSANLKDDQRSGFDMESLDREGRLFLIQLYAEHSPIIYSSVPGLETVAQLRSGIGEVLEWADSREVVSLVQHPFWYDIARVLPNSRMVYDCMDHHEGFGNTAKEILSLERSLLRDADLTVTTSAWLDQIVAEYAPRRVLIRNACEFDHFAHKPVKIYSDPQGRQILGYYGAIAEWFDQGLVEEIARRFPDCCVLLVGCDSVRAQARLGRLSNIKFIGEVPYAELPYYLHGFDVCLLPFHVVDLTLATNPVKIYEYLSAGKPVVSVNLPEMRQFGNFVRTAESSEDFILAVADALNRKESPEEVNQRKSFAKEQTWMHRAEDLIAHAETRENDPKTSVIVVTFNNIDLTRSCLSSLDKHSHYGNMEVIVVDNASSDGTRDFLDDWVAAAPDRKVIFNEHNRGFAAANNQGLAAADGEYLVLLNNDTYVTPGWISTLVKHLERDRSIGLIGPVTNAIANEAQINVSYRNMVEMLKKSAHYTRGHIGQIFPLRTAAFFCVMMSRQTYERVGDLDEAFGRGFFEDDDYCRRVEQLGLRIVCAEDVFVHHHFSASFNKLKDREQRDLFEQNKAIYEAKWGKWVPHTFR